MDTLTTRTSTVDRQPSAGDHSGCDPVDVAVARRWDKRPATVHARRVGRERWNAFVADVAAEFKRRGEMDRYEAWLAPIRAVEAGDGPDEPFHHLHLAYARSDASEDVAEAVFVGRLASQRPVTVAQAQAWITAIQRERADGLRLETALRRLYQDAGARRGA